jgi:hypothetical protein
MIIFYLYKLLLITHQRHFSCRRPIAQNRRIRPESTSFRRQLSYFASKNRHNARRPEKSKLQTQEISTRLALNL